MADVIDPSPNVPSRVTRRRSAFVGLWIGVLVALALAQALDVFQFFAALTLVEGAATVIVEEGIWEAVADVTVVALASLGAVLVYRGVGAGRLLGVAGAALCFVTVLITGIEGMIETSRQPVGDMLLWLLITATLRIVVFGAAVAALLLTWSYVPVQPATARPPVMEVRRDA